jgi:hypothetical protein
MKKYGWILGVVLIVFIGIKEFVVYSASINDYVLLSDKEPSGMDTKIVLTPDNEVVVIKSNDNVAEGAVYKIKGRLAKHYAFGLYCIGTFPLGLRYYPNAEKVMESSLELVQKDGDSFPELGSEFSVVIVLYKDKASFDGKILNKIELDAQKRNDIHNLVHLIKSSME